MLFLAKVPSVGYAVFDVRPAAAPAASTLQVSATSLENDRYRVQLDGNGDIGSLFDKTLRQELLSSPARLAFQFERPRDWPAWNMDWRDQQNPPRGYVLGPAKTRVTEQGPVRVSLEVSARRRARSSCRRSGSRRATPARGSRSRTRSTGRSATPRSRPTFPLTARNPLATYNWDIGTIERGNNDERKYEVPSHQWFDLTDQGGALRRHRALGLQVRLRQARRPDAAADAALHARHRRGQRPRLRRPGDAGLGAPRVRLRARRARRRLPPGAHRLARPAPQPAAGRVHHGVPRGPPGQGLLARPARQPARPCARPEEGRGGRGVRRASGRAGWQAGPRRATGVRVSARRSPRGHRQRDAARPGPRRAGRVGDRLGAFRRAGLRSPPGACPQAGQRGPVDAGGPRARRRRRHGRRCEVHGRVRRPGTQPGGRDAAGVDRLWWYPLRAGASGVRKAERGGRARPDDRAAGGPLLPRLPAARLREGRQEGHLQGRLTGDGG